MDFENFKKLPDHVIYSLGEGIDISAEDFDLYIKTIDSDEIYTNWILKLSLEESNFDYGGYCCLKMAHRMLECWKMGDNPRVIVKRFENGSYGIPVYDGTSRSMKIAYCPWCGKELNEYD